MLVPVSYARLLEVVLVVDEFLKQEAPLTETRNFSFTYHFFTSNIRLILLLSELFSKRILNKY